MSFLRSTRHPARVRSSVLPMGRMISQPDVPYNEVHVSTIEEAQRTTAFDAALSLCASLVSETPVYFYDAPYGDSGRRRVDPPPHLQAPFGLGGISGDGYDIQDWLYQAAVSFIGRSNVWARVVDTMNFRGTEYITQLDLIHPDRIGPPMGSRVYTDTLKPGMPWLMDGREDPTIRHWRADPLPGIIIAPSLIEKHAITLRLPQAALKFGEQWFIDGAHPTAMLSNKYADQVTLGDEQVRSVKGRFLAATRGNREPVVLGRGWEYTPLSLKANESQFLETLGYSQSEVARLFGPGVAEVLGYSSATGAMSHGGGQTYANIESRAAHLVVFGLGRWFGRLERLLYAMCPRNRWPSFDRTSILNTTPERMWATLSVALNCRGMVPNEARNIAGLPPVEWGDEPLAAPGGAASADGAASPGGDGGAK